MYTSEKTTNHIKLLLLFLVLLSTITGCGDKNSTANHNSTTENSVQAVLDSQTSTTEAVTIEATTTEDISSESTEYTYTPYIDEPDIVQPNSDEEGIDYDLTKMDSNMIYATVYQLMVNPSAYEGKTVRIIGLYHGAYYEENERFYHYCIIEDAIGCCSQGMEFIWEDGSHIYPDEYPEENETIIVTGTFESYQEKSDAFSYVRLNNATLTR